MTEDDFQRIELGGEPRGVMYATCEHHILDTTAVFKLDFQREPLSVAGSWHWSEGSLAPLLVFLEIACLFVAIKFQPSSTRVVKRHEESEVTLKESEVTLKESKVTPTATTPGQAIIAASEKIDKLIIDGAVYVPEEEELSPASTLCNDEAEMAAEAQEKGCVDDGKQDCGPHLATKGAAQTREGSRKRGFFGKRTVTFKAVVERVDVADRVKSSLALAFVRLRRRSKTSAFYV